MVIKKERIMQCFNAALETYEKNAIAQQHIANDLLKLLLEKGGSRFHRVLEIGCGTGNFTRLLMQNIEAEHWDCNDLCDVSAQLMQNLPLRNYNFYQGCGESLVLSAQYDLIVSASTIQWFSDPLAFLYRCSTHLIPNSMILLSTFAPTNLPEIRALSQIGLDYPNLAQWRETLMANFHIIHLSQKEIRLEFYYAFSLLRHLKDTGVTATNNRIWNREKVARFCEQYHQHYINEQGKVSLTYVPIFMLARKKENA